MLLSDLRAGRNGTRGVDVAVDGARDVAGCGSDDDCGCVGVGGAKHSLSNGFPIT